MRHAIGAGALGPVFRAHEADADRDVAVKLFRLDLPPERAHELVGQFDRLIAAGLAHPALVAPVASGIAGTQAYLVEELVAGDSLDVVLRDRAISSPADALRVVTQIAAALDAAAARGLFHGSLHPRDVLDADGDSVRLTGIGIAQALETVAAAVPVRRPYASPERVTGVRWDRRADVFSLAALAHEMLWARRLTGVGEQAASALDEVTGGDLNALRRVFAQGLAPSPGDRFETAGAFSATLSECFGAVGHAAIRASAPPRRRTPVDVRPTPERVQLPSPEEPRLPLDDSAPVAPIAKAQTSAPALPTPSMRAPKTPAPVATRLIKERPVESPLAPVRVEVAAPPAEDLPLGRRNRGAARATELLTQPERPLPIVLPAPPADRDRSGFLSLGLTAAVFLAVGFAGGYWVASWSARPAANGMSAVTSMNDAASANQDTVLPGANVAAASPVNESTTAAAPVVPPEPAPEPPAIAAQAAPTPAPAPVPAEVTARDVAPPRPAAPAPRPAAAPPARPAPVVPGVLQVDSRPSGAEVFVDGRSRGRTPLQIEGVPVGDHGVRLALEGYVEWLAAVQITSGGRHRVAASLEPRN
ncbi:MAG: PEGA domain-containing protein [Vicinamibacterales bacterium]